MNKILISYLAGIIDGEGYIGIKKNNSSKISKSPVFSERLCVTISNKSVLELLKKQFGGAIIKRKYYNQRIRNNLTIYSWEVTDRSALKTLTILYPFIKIKKSN